MGLKVGDTVKLPPGATIRGPDGSVQWNPDWVSSLPTAEQTVAAIGRPTPTTAMYDPGGSIFDGYGIGMAGGNPGTRADGSIGIGNSTGFTQWLKDLGTYAGREALDAAIQKVLGPTSDNGNGSGTPAGADTTTRGTEPVVVYTGAPGQAAGGVAGISSSTLLLLGAMAIGAVVLARVR